MTRNDLMQRALIAYWKSLAIVDPLRLEQWESARVTLPLLRVLVYLRERPGAPAGEVARYMQVTASNVTGLVDRLVKQRLVRREGDDEDRRVSRHFLTGEGETVLGSAQQRGTKFVAQILEELSDRDLEHLVEVFDRLWEAAKRARAHAGVSHGARPQGG